MKKIILFLIAIIYMCSPIFAQQSIDIVGPISESFSLYLCWPYILIVWAVSYIALNFIGIGDQKFPKIWVVIIIGVLAGAAMYFLGFCQNLNSIVFSMPFSVLLHKAISSPLKNYLGIEL